MKRGVASKRVRILVYTWSIKVSQVSRTLTKVHTTESDKSNLTKISKTSNSCKNEQNPKNAIKWPHETVWANIYFCTEIYIKLWKQSKQKTESQRFRLKITVMKTRPKIVQAKNDSKDSGSKSCQQNVKHVYTMSLEIGPLE